MTRNGLAFALMCLVWGLTWWPLKVAAAEVPPIFLAGVRFVLAGAGFLAWGLGAGLSFRTVLPGRLAASTLLITPGCYAFLFWGVAHAPSGLSAIVNFALMPVTIGLFGALHGEERVTGRRALATGLGAVGLVLLFLPRIGPDALRDPGPVLGLAAVVAATASYAWGAVLSRPLMRGTAPVALAAWQTGAGGLVLLALSLALEPVTLAHAAALLRPPALPALAFLVVAGSLVGFSIYLRLLRDWGAFRSGLYAFVSPTVAVAAGILALGEPFGWPEAAGSAVLLGATALSLGDRGPARASRPDP